MIGFLVSKTPKLLKELIIDEQVMGTNLSDQDSSLKRAVLSDEGLAIIHYDLSDVGSGWSSSNTACDDFLPSNTCTRNKKIVTCKQCKKNEKIPDFFMEEFEEYKEENRIKDRWGILDL